MLSAALILATFAMANSANLSLSFEPESVRVRTNNFATVQASFEATEPMTFRIEFTCENRENCETVNSTLDIFLHPGNYFFETYNFSIRGLYLGRTKLSSNLLEQNPDVQLLVDPLKIAVLRSDRGATLSKIFTYFMAVVVVLMVFMMGTQLKIEAIKDCIKKPIGPVIGFSCQYVFMPLIAFGWACVFLSDYPSLQFGYFAVGCSPGGGNSNFWTILLEGNLDLSVTMTFFSNLAAIGMLPFWIFTLGRVFFQGEVEIPFLDVLQSLALLIIPAFFGLALTHYKPHLRIKFERSLKIFVFVILLATLPFAIYANFYIFRLFRWYTIVPGILLPWTGYFVSYLIAFLLKQPHANCRTIAIETGIQNATIAMVMCRFSLPEPDSDMTLVMPVCALMFTSVPLWVFLIGFKIYKKKHSAQVQSNDQIEMDDGTKNNVTQLSADKL